MPAIVPPIVTRSGIIKCSKSMNVPMIRNETKIQYAIATCHQKLSQIARKRRAVTSSTAKWRKEILAPQFAQRPRGTIQLINGKLWCQRTDRLQFGQKERRGL